MDNIKEKIISHFILTCIEEKYMFLVSDLQIKCITIEEKYNKNSYWVDGDINEICKKIIESLLEDKKEYSLVLHKFSSTFYEKIWLKCKSKIEKDFLISSLISAAINNYKPFSILELSKNEDYINQVIYHCYTEKYKLYDNLNNKLNELIDVSLKNKFIINEKNLMLACHKEKKHYLNNLLLQKKLKDYVEKYLPSSIDKLKKYWKNLDPNLINEKIEEKICYYLTFNKNYIYSLRLNEPIIYFERKLKAVSVFLNQKKVQDFLKIQRIVFDGIQINQSEYRYFIIKNENQKNENIKKIISDFIIKVISLDIIKKNDMNKVFRYEVLNEKLIPKQKKIIKLNKI